MTRAEKIKNMTDKELANFLFDFMISCTKPDGVKSPNGYLEWLNEDIENEVE